MSGRTDPCPPAPVACVPAPLAHAAFAAPMPHPARRHEAKHARRRGADSARRREAAVRLARMVAAVALLAAALALPVLIAAPAQAKAPPKGFAASPPGPAPAPRIPDGSIFNVAAGYAPLIEGNRARAVGDIVNIVLIESTTTSKTTATKQSRSGSEALTPPTIGPFSFNPNALNAGATASFNGQGNTAQTDALNGSIAVTIAEVRPNGTVLVRGQKQMMLSQGTEWITISGLVRIADIDPTTDSVLSTQVADAHIEYSGNGSIQRTAREGWLSRAFNLLSPF